jgi:hypothetical protein
MAWRRSSAKGESQVVGAGWRATRRKELKVDGVEMRLRRLISRKAREGA